MRRITAILVAAVSLCTVVWLTRGNAIEGRADEPRASASIPPAGVAPPAISAPRILGSRSCSAVSCHGNVDYLLRTNSPESAEFQFWLENDPHYNAYRALHNPLGKRMLDLLRVSMTDSEYEAAYQNCLKCHATTGASGPVFTDGVGCESCHGPAENWIATHYVDLNGDGQSDWSKREPGVIDTDDLATRTQTCVACHVGAADRDVNHDLIAAGHPPLKFEMTLYMERLPAHWDREDERGSDSDREVKLWRLGQMASAHAATQLLLSRANSERGEWPELSEFDCFSCHHDLAHPSWRQKLPADLRNDGQAGWGDWYVSLAGKLLAPNDARHVEEDQRKIRHSQTQLLGMREGSNEISKSAESLVERFRSWPTDGFGRDDLRKLLDDVSRDQTAMSSWDRATQVFLAMVVLDVADRRSSSSAKSATDAEIERGLEQLRDLLAFPEAYDSPRDFVGDIDDESGARDGSNRKVIWNVMKHTIQLLQQR